MSKILGKWIGSGQIANAHIASDAAIAYSKLALAGSVLASDIAVSAGIPYSKLDLVGSIGDADIAANAAIAYTKLALSGSITDDDIASSAAISYGKLALSGSVTNADIATDAAIAYSKLDLAASISDSDVASDAAIAYTKLNLTDSIVAADISAAAAIPYSKLDLALSILNSDLAEAITYSNLSIADGDLAISKTSGLQTALDAKLPLSGGTMTGNIAMGDHTISGLANGVNPTDAVNKSQLDAALAGLDFQSDVDAMVADASSSYPGDGTLPAASTGQRYILQGGTGSLHANWGTITGIGDGDIVEYDGSDWVVAYDVSAAGAGAICWDTTDTYFVYWNGTAWGEFGGMSAATAGIGLSRSGNVLNVNLGAGIKQLPSDEVGLDLATYSGLKLTDETAEGQLSLDVKGTVETDVTNPLALIDGLYLKYNLLQFDQTQARLTVKAGGIGSTELAATSVTAAKLGNDIVGTGLSGGNGNPIRIATGGVEYALLHDLLKAKIDDIGEDVVDAFTLSAGDITAKGVTLSRTPKADTQVRVLVDGAPEQFYGVDFTVSGTALTWDVVGSAMLAALASGDKLRVYYETAAG